MKKIFRLIVFSLLIIGYTPTLSLAAELPLTVNSNPIEVQKQIDRLNEIKSMDVKTLSREQRKELRHEVKSIKKTTSSNGGVYLSVGAIIIIILLLILIL